MSRIHIVTGAAGFLGSVICRQLVEAGKRVRAFVLPGDKNAQFLPKDVEIVEGDVCDMESLERLFKVDDDSRIVVLHIASIVTVNPDHNERVISVNVGGTANIIAMCRRTAAFEKLVYCGSTGSIPEQPKGMPIAECASYDPDRVMGCYSRSKAMAAQLVVDAAAEGLNATIVHPTGIMGPDDFSLSETTSTLIKIIRGDMPMGIAGSFNLVDVRDLAAGTISAIDHGRKGESYILGNDDVSFKHFARLVARESGCPPLKFFLPLRLANAVARQMERKARRTGERPLMTTFSVYNLARNNAFDSSKARRELGFAPRSYAETIHDQVAWLLKEGHINSNTINKSESMTKSKTKGMTKGVVKTYMAIENAVVGSYKAIENAAVGGYKAIEEATVGAYKSVEDTAVNMGKSLMEEYNNQKKSSEKK